MKKKHCDLNFWSIDSPNRKGGLVDMVLVGFILIIDAHQAETLHVTDNSKEDIGYFCLPFSV